MRSSGAGSSSHVRFLRISSRLQIAVIGIAAALLFGWAAATLFMLFSRADIAMERAALSRQQAAVKSAAGKITAYERSAGSVARQLEQRLGIMEELSRSRLGVAPASAAPEQQPGRKTSSALPAVERLKTIEHRQRTLARQLAGAFDARARKTADALRQLGLDPRRLLASASLAQGGPYIPLRGEDGKLNGELKALAASVTRLDILESNLAAIPSSRPTAAPMVTSSYGLRRDPFNGNAAFHAGIDFVGTYGQPILSAANGRIAFVGQRQGYGNVVEVDHGNGIMTRYAHLSGFAARPGQRVLRGQPIARMGSTGRSTGTHLHFEVRMNGTAVNPRRFLEANRDVLEIQQVASQRFGDARRRG